MDFKNMTDFEKEELFNKILGNNNVSFVRFKAKMLDEILSSKYQLQAIQFLLDTETTCKIDYLGLSYPSWNDKNKVFSYEVTLKNKKHSYSFRFYDSIHNTDKNIKATFDFYSVLACLDLCYTDSFDDFCREYGYESKNESEYLKVRSIYHEVIRQDENLRLLFTPDELEKLAEIN